jgi:hypothetical protein
VDRRREGARNREDRRRERVGNQRRVNTVELAGASEAGILVPDSPNGDEALPFMLGAIQSDAARHNSACLRAHRSTKKPLRVRCMSGFVKLYGSITTSSVWSESKETRLLWITMLAMADGDGKVDASVPGLARTANISLGECESALAVLQGPDPYSRTKELDGRRIDPVDGGWLILNHQKYRDMRTETQIQTAERVKRHRERMKEGVTSNDCNDEKRTDAEGEVEAEAYPDKSTSTTTPAPEGLTIYDVLGALGLDESSARNKWLLMLDGMTQGIGTAGMKAVSVDTLHEAAEELSIAEGDVTVHRFKIFVNKVVQRQARVVAENPRSRNDSRPPTAGNTLHAAELIKRVGKAHNEYMSGRGYVLPANWREQFTAVELRVIEALGPSRIRNTEEKDQSFLVAQVSKALDESERLERRTA